MDDYPFLAFTLFLLIAMFLISFLINAIIYAVS